MTFFEFIPDHCLRLEIDACADTCVDAALSKCEAPAPFVDDGR